MVQVIRSGSVALWPIWLLSLVIANSNLVPTPRIVTNCTTEFQLMFVVDATESYNVTEIMSIKSSILSFTNAVVSENKKVGVVFKGTLANIPPSNDKNFITASIAPLVEQGSVASTSGISDAANMYTTRSVPLVMVVITKATLESLEKRKSSQNARNAGIDIFAIGISNSVPLSTLVDLSSSGSNIYKTTPSNLTLSVDDIQYSVCTFSGIPPPIQPSFPENISTIDCKLTFDLVLVLDGSATIGVVDFQTLKTDVRTFINTLPVNTNDVHVGLVLFSNDVARSIPLSADRVQLTNQINALPYPEQGTNTHMGLDEAARLIQTGGRTGYPRAVVVITDGISDNPTLTAAAATRLKRDGAIIYTIGVGLVNADTAEMQSIATLPSYFFAASGFNTLMTILQESTFNACPTTPVPSTTVTTIPPPQTTPSITTTKPKACGSSIFDLMIVIDSSSAATAPGFTSIKAAVQDFISSIPTNVGFKISVTIFGSSAQGSPLFEDTSAINSIVTSLPFLGGTVSVDKGLQTAVSILTASSRNVEQHILVITTGQSENMNLTSIVADITRNISINTYAMGVGRRVSLADLENIAGDISRIFYASELKNIHVSLDNFRRMLCSPVKVTIPPTYITTTTTAPTSTKSFAKDVLHHSSSDGICSAVLLTGVDMGVGLHPTQCDKYIQCYANSTGAIIAVHRQCPFGQFWDNNNNKCNYVNDVTCPYETCTATCDKMTKMDGSCRSYWECIGGKPQPKCCPIGFTFVQGFGCKPDFYCRDPCPGKCLRPEPCDKKPDWSNMMGYMMYMGKTGYIPMSCKPGYFDVAECGCSYSNTQKTTCKTKIKLNFTNANQLQSNKRMGMVVNNVNVYFGAALFTGDNYLRYNIMMNNSNNMLSGTKHRLSISFRYRETLPVDRMRVVFSTGDCGKGGRMYITHDATAIYFKVESKYGAYTNITIATNEFPPYAWKEVMFVYDGKMILTHVRAGNLLQVSKLPATVTNILECGFGVGIGGLIPGYRGELDDLSVNVCDN